MPTIDRIGYPGRPVQRVASRSRTSSAISGDSSRDETWPAAETTGTFGTATELHLCGPDPGKLQLRRGQSVLEPQPYGWVRTEKHPCCGVCGTFVRPPW